MSDQINLYQPLALFVPNSAGDSESLFNLTLQAASQTFPFLSHLLSAIGHPKLMATPMERFSADVEGQAAAATLKSVFDKYGSDKSTGRNYHHLYAEILRDRGRIAHVLEIGLGTHHLDVVSNMGAQGVPGASLRAFREYLPNAQIFGADVDRRVLFQEHRIQTHFVDQTDPGSLETLAAAIPDGIDLIIDDGLHAPNANLAVLAFGLPKLKRQGWLVIEDIPVRAVPLWEVVSALLPEAFSSQLIRAEGALVFAVKKA